MSRADELERIMAAQPLPPGRNGNGRWKIDPRLAMSIVGWLTTILISWGVSWGGFNARVSVLEVQRQEDAARLQRLELKVDELLRRP